MSPGRWLLCRILPPAERAVADEIEEARDARHPEGGWRAVAWYWRQVLSLTARFWLERRREARRSFNLPESRDTIMSVLIEEGRHAFRHLSRRPGLSLSIIAVLAVGIGPAVAVFTVANGLLLRPLPYEDPGRLGLVRIDLSGLTAHPGIAQAEVLDLRREMDLAEGVEALTSEFNASFGRGEEMSVIRAISATRGLFDLIGVEPAVGRDLGSVQEGGESEVLVSHEFWVHSMGGDPDRVGQGIEIDGDRFTVVGVLPPDFRLLLGPGAGVSPDVDVWFLLDLDPAARDFWGYRTLVRLEAGATFEQARAEIAAVGERLVATYPETYEEAGIRFDIRPLHSDLVAPVRPAVLVLLGAVGLVLLIACNNAAGLLLAGTLSRSEELAVRRALGAGKGRVLLQVMLESLAMAAVAGGVGLLGARLGLDALLASRPADLPRAPDMILDGTVVGFAIGVTGLACLVFGSLPAWHASRMAAGQGLRGDGRGSVAVHIGSRNALVIAQVAFSVILLVGAGLLIRTIDRLGRVELGFVADEVLALRVPIDTDLFDPPEERWIAYRQVLERLRSLPAVEAVGGMQYSPLDGRSFRTSYSPDVDSTDEWNGTSADYRWVFPGTLETMGIPLLAGRGLVAADIEQNRPVAVVDESLARQLWPDDNAVGKRLRVMVETPFLPEPVVEIVGVMAHPRIIDVRRQVRPQIWMPYSVVPREEMSVLVRSSGDPEAVLPAVREAIRASGTGRPVHTVRPLAGLVADASADTRFALKLMGSLALVALALSAAGIYSVLAYLVRRRIRETGVRMALGAESADILRRHIGEGVRLTGIGLILGVVGALAVAGSLEAMLFGVAPRDPITFAVVVGAVAAVAVLASWLPARRASRIDPARALRSR